MKQKFQGGINSFKKSHYYLHLHRMERHRSYLVALWLLSSFWAYAQEPELVVSEPLVASVVVADPPLVKTVGDTVQFNPSALILEEDAVLEDILRKIPGVDVEGGVVTLYGRKVEKLLVEGRLYYGGDILTGLRNIQGDSVESIKAYVRPGDFARATGIDDGEEESVLDVKIKRRFMEGWEGRIQAGGSYPLRYMASGNAGMLTDSVHASVLANFRNTPAVVTPGNQRPVKLGTGADGDRARRDAGADYSKNGKHLDMDASIKYTGYNYERQRTASAQNFYRNSTSYVSQEDDQSGLSNNVTAQAEINWKPSRQWTFLLKPQLSIQGTQSLASPVSYTYKSAPWLDEDADAVNRTEQLNSSDNRRLDWKITAQGTRRMTKKGRTVSLRLYEAFTTADATSNNHYTGLTFKNGKATQRDYLIQAPWKRNEFYIQGSWNEPLGHGFHLQLLANARRIRHSMSRDYYFLASGEHDDTFSSDGIYQGTQLTAMTSLRYVKKKVNVTAGVAVKPVWSTVNGTIHSTKVYAAPNLTLRYNRSKTQYMSLRYTSAVGTPSPSNLIPVKSGTNPLYIHEGNPELSPSFTQKMVFTYNHSVPAKGNSLVAEATASMVQNAFSSATEYIPETGGRIIRSRNIDGTWNAGGSLVMNHSFKSLPLSISSHTDGEFAHTPSFLYNSATREDEINNWRRTSVRERLDAAIRWKRFSLTLSAGGEYTHEHSLVFDDLDYEPWALFSQADAAVSLRRRWRISSNIGLYCTRGHGFDPLDRDICLWNASVSKGFAGGKCTLRLTANDILNQSVHFTYQSNSITHRYYAYNGFGRIILLQLLWRLGK